MTTTLVAIYKNGALKLPSPLPLAENTHVTVTIRTESVSDSDLDRETWLELSERQLTRTWDNAADDIFNELRDK